MFTSLRLSFSTRINGIRSHRYFTREQERALGAILALIVVSFGAIIFLHRGPSPIPTPAVSIAIPTKPQVTPNLVIDVEGKVAHPGVLTLPSGSRAIDALTAAGGALAGVDLSDINLAHLIVDGEEIVVGAPKVVTTSRGGSQGKVKKAKAGTSSVSINSGTAPELESLPGVGPVMAGRIIAYRKAHGPFIALDQLRKVSGMGAAKYGAISSLIHL